MKFLSSTLLGLACAGFSADKGVLAAATGSGGFIAANGELRKFTFAAITHGDGTVRGQFELVAGDADLVAHGTVM